MIALIGFLVVKQSEQPNLNRGNSTPKFVLVYAVCVVTAWLSQDPAAFHQMQSIKLAEL